GTALMVLELISRDSCKFSEIVDEFAKYPDSGEINFSVPDAAGTITAIKRSFIDAKTVDELDGLSVWYDNWWFNIRGSHTEPLIRLNVEADNHEILQQKTDVLIAQIESLGGKKK
ncbi:MAG: phosphomannomutase, partial [Patescibacteria group bacterium]